MDTLTKTIWEITEGTFEDENLFVVDISISTGRSQKVTILLDGDNGVSIDDCSRVSRAVGHEIEERDLIKNSYTLDVGSPGVDTPLKSERQFRKNTGRKLKVKLSDGSTVKGVLHSVDQDSIELASKKGKEKSRITFNDIEWAKVQVTFNNT